MRRAVSHLKEGCETPLLDDLIGQQEQGGGHLDPERLGSLEIDDQRELCRLLYGQVGGLGALEELVHVGGRAVPME